MDFTGFEVLDLRLGCGDDVLSVEDTIDGATTIRSGAGADRVVVEATGTGTTQVLGGTGDDWLLVNGVPVPGEANALLGRLTLDGEAGSDYYLIAMFGSGGSRVDVADTGLLTDTNVLVINGSAANDTFLFAQGRRQHRPGRAALGRVTAPAGSTRPRRSPTPRASTAACWSTASTATTPSPSTTT